MIVVPFATIRKPLRQLRIVSLGLVALLLLAGCSSVDSDSTAAEPTLLVDNDTISIPELNVRVTFDETVSGTEQEADVTVHRTSFYDGEQLVFTAYDTDGDGRDDLWFEYDDARRLTMEFHDTDGDGQPDRALRFDRGENVLEEISLPIE